MRGVHGELAKLYANEPQRRALHDPAQLTHAEPLVARVQGGRGARR